MQRFSLIINILLIILTSASIFYNIQQNLFLLGIALGCIFSLPSLLTLFNSNYQMHNVLFRVNTFIIVAIVILLFFVLYIQLTSGVKGLFFQHLLCLSGAIGLCANSQQLINNKNIAYDESVDIQLHRIFGGPSVALVFALALVVTAALQTSLVVIADENAYITILKNKLIDRGIIPFITIAIFMWGLLLLIGNFFIVRFATRALFSNKKEKINILQMAFQKSCDESNASTHTKKQIQLQTFMDSIWNKVHYFYSVPRYINWAIPILGFIGTVFGISLAAESIGKLISSNDTGFGSALGDAVAPLGIAFDTTLVALTLSVILMLVQSLLQRWQERQLHAVEQTIRHDL